MKAVGPSAPLGYSPFADASKSSCSSNGEIQTCSPSSQIQQFTSSKSLFGLWAGKGAVMASLHRLGSAFGLNKLTRKSRDSNLKNSKARTIASSAHGGCQYRSFADVILPTPLRHSVSTLDLDQIDDPSTRAHTHGRRLPFVTAATAAAAAATAAATDALSPTPYGINGRALYAQTGTSSRLFNSPVQGPQPAPQSAPPSSLQTSCVSEQLVQFQRGQMLVKSNRNQFAALNLDASLSAPPNFPQLQQVCTAFSSGERKPQPQPQAAAAKAATHPAPPAPNASSEKSEPRAKSSVPDKQAEGTQQQQQPPQQQQRQATDHPSHQQPGSSLPLPPGSAPGQTRNNAEPSALIGTSRSLPPGMRRSHWSIEDYSITRRLFKGDRTAVYKV
ncbi:hypothetical protein Vretifemale_10487 [Volvox reticuliferus]|uniref:Uncharacterized protein n=1 Tax=Volvox reticuliferus TaxID=1737510 RepID=A0A8J4FMQ9_9CHLO|nr:hypothetical protein Vretifemale_10487 [Volvox reticuliferus]